MGKVTALEVQKKNPKRVNLFVEGKFVVGLPTEAVFQEKLEIGKELDEKESKHLIELSGRQKILDRVFKFLSYRPRSQKEICDYLRRKKIDEKEIVDVLAELKKGNYLNDEEFAKWWIEQRMTFRPSGSRLLTVELQQKGIPKEIIVKLLNCYIAEEGKEVDLAKRVAEKKIRLWRSLPDMERKQKLIQALARRGFDWETIEDVVDESFKKK